MVVIREKCPGCEMNEPNQLAHEFYLFVPLEKQVNVCFKEVYDRVIWEEVLDNWYKKVVERPVNLNPETLKQVLLDIQAGNSNLAKSLSEESNHAMYQDESPHRGLLSLPN